MSRKLTACRWLYALFLLGVGLLFAVQLRSGGWLQTDLRSLLPQESQWTAVQQAADRQQEAVLNRQLIALVGHREPSKAFALATQTAEQWQTSGLFSAVFYQTTPDLAKLRQELTVISFATLPHAVRTELQNTPQHYFQHYAEQLANPFQNQNLLPLEQDWLGFGRFAFSHANALSQLAWNAENGMLFRQQDGITWVLLQAELNEADFINPSDRLLNQLAASRQSIEAAQGQLLAAGTSLFAAHAKQQAEQESQLMSGVGISLTLLLLLAVFRSLRVLWLFLPIAVGMLAGVVATVGYLGQIHILTLVIGTSLIGMLIDFPLHWLASSRFSADWQPQKAMSALRFTFFISLLVTLLGYGLLAFTPLPVLQQTALFSAAALVCAVVATGVFLPTLFARYRPNSAPACGGSTLRSKGKGAKYYLAKSKVKLTACLLPTPSQARVLPPQAGAECQPVCSKSYSAFTHTLLIIMVGIGIAKSEWHDDIRQWVSLDPQAVSEAQQISQISGADFGSQYLLVVAENDENLLISDQSLTQSISTLQQQGKLSGFQSLSQWIMPQAEQKALAERLSQTIKPDDYAVLSELGIEVERLETSLKNLPEQPLVSLQQALATEAGRAWRQLYLGELSEGKVATIVKLNGLQNIADITPLVDHQTVFWQDKRASLNAAFEQSRNQAAWLKVLSFGLAGLLLWRFFGIAQTAKMLLVPFGAMAATVAVFGWFGVPISLFAMFGLLLVSAIAIDYTAYMQTAPETLPTKRFAIGLAAATTLISFLLLSLSSTPAVAAFGLSVSLGVGFSMLMTFKLFK